ncbi:MAG: LuxR C-terminal-related transcriptional regulator [Thermomicrobiales bacterium]
MSAPFAHNPSREPAPWPLPRVQTSRTVGFPTGLPLLIGRDTEIAQAAALLTDSRVRLLTVTGPAGVGKTRVALAAAAETAASFNDGAVFIPLAHIPDANEILRSIARALEIRQAPGRTPFAALAAALAQRNLLLVLDNLEQVPAVAGDLGRLVDACPGVVILATSRIPLRVVSERRLGITPLRLPQLAEQDASAISATDAAALFVNRARHVQPDFQLTSANAADVAAVCRRLDGLPLAIELAAAWSHLLAPATLRARLDRSLPWLVGGAVDQAARLQSMRAAIAWSDDLLPPDVQRLFYRLSIFTGGFTLEGAAALWNAERLAGAPDSEPDGPASAERVLAGLVDANLVQSSLGRDGQPRFTLLETVREYAQERLAATTEAAMAAHIHAHHMLQVVETAEPLLLGPSETEQQLLLRDDHANISAAMAWGITHEPALAQRIGASLWAYWLLQGLVGEGYDWLVAALDAGDSPPEIRAMALIACGAVATMQSNGVAARPLQAEALQLADQLADPLLHARAHFINGAIAMEFGQFKQAADSFAWSASGLASSSRTIDRGVRSWSCLWQGLASSVLGDDVASNALAAHSLQIASELGSSTLYTVGSTYVADMLLRSGQRDQAEAILALALAVAEANGDVLQFGGLWPMSELLLGLAAVDFRQGNAVLAAQRYGAGQAIMLRLGINHQPPLEVQARKTLQDLYETLGVDQTQALMQEGARDPFAVALRMLPGYDPGGVAAASDREPQPAATHLSAREQQVLAGIAQGMTDSEIAAALYISRKTVSNHVSRILDKLDVRTRTAAVAAWTGRQE